MDMAFARRENIVLFIGDCLRYAMTIEFNNRTGLSMQRKLLQAVSVKSIPLIIDTVVNSVPVVYLNIYQTFRFVGKVKSNFLKQPSRGILKKYFSEKMKKFLIKCFKSFEKISGKCLP